MTASPASSPRLLRRWLIGLLVMVSGCAPPAPVSPDTLAYPVLVLFPQHGGVRHDDVADLRMMSVQRVMAYDGSVMLIDSRLDIYRLDGLESEHSGLWLMAHPNGRTEVRFALQPTAQADLGQARQLILDREPGLHGPDASALRQALSQATTLSAMLALLGK